MTAKILLLLIRGYQLVGSPILGGSCRFVPSCSAYAAEAVAQHGARRGSWLILRRLSRCHPLGRSGYDPVPVCAASPARSGRSGANLASRASRS